jgi:hypothetical protein
MAAAVLIAAQLTPARAADDATPPMPTVGEKAPQFTLPSQDGTPVSLTDFKGKWVVVYFYPRDMTPGCTIEAHNFQNSLPQFEAKHAVILGVSVDSKESHQQFQRQPDLQAAVRHRTHGGERVWLAGRLQRHGDGQPQHVPHRSQGEGLQGVDEGESGDQRIGCSFGFAVGCRV